MLVGRATGGSSRLLDHRLRNRRRATTEADSASIDLGSEDRDAAMRSLLTRLATQRTTYVGRWTRDELYDD